MTTPWENLMFKLKDVQNDVVILVGLKENIQTKLEGLVRDMEVVAGAMRDSLPPEVLPELDAKMDILRSNVVKMRELLN